MNVIITGASRGIGKAIAEIFAANGHALYLCSKNEVALYKTMEELLLKYPGSKIKAKARDLSKKEEVENFGQWLLDNGIRIDVLVNNAGNFLPGSIQNEEAGALEEMIAVNLYSAYFLTRKLLPSMMKQQQVNGTRGHIFNMCSIASLAAYSNGGSYSISKFALNGFSKNLREEMKPHHIKVTAVFPGAVMTDSWGDYDNSANRIMEAEDIAKMMFASAMLSPQACVEEILIRPQLGDL
ncbi:MAG: SDR family oxidoreductase [Chitinophagaceae bacterium]|jgi:short-subunit dehydrogenase|nr:SDR family oxidoreductase [Chitinophagaceae bacterium]